jgi:hypothetical protein
MGFIKVREGKYKGEHGEAQVESRGEESVFLLFRKPMISYWTGRTRRFPSNNQ